MLSLLNAFSYIYLTDADLKAITHRMTCDNSDERPTMERVHTDVELLGNIVIHVSRDMHTHTIRYINATIYISTTILVEFVVKQKYS